MSQLGHSRPSRAGSNSSQVRYAAESGSRFVASRVRYAVSRPALSPSRIARASVSPIERRASLFSRPPHEGGSLAEIFWCLRATKWLLLHASPPHLRTIPAPYVPLKLVDRCCLGSADHIERNGLVRIAARARHFEPITSSKAGGLIGNRQRRF
jgi:hypothetical protein